MLIFLELLDVAGIAVG